MSLPHIRQVVVATNNLRELGAEICAIFDVKLAFKDDLSVFGLENVLIPFGHDFVEVLTPIVPNQECAGGRWIDRHGGDCGYMVIAQVSDFEAAVAPAEAHEIRSVWDIDREAFNVDILARHLHPADIGGAILSLDEMQPTEHWPWAGPREHWLENVSTSRVTGVDGVVFVCKDPLVTATKWGDVLDVDSAECQRGDEPSGYELAYGSSSVRFIPCEGPYADLGLKGSALLAGFDIRTSDKKAILATAKQRHAKADDTSVWLGGVRWNLGSS